MEKNCLNCGQKFFGRIDKKYCSDQCRSAFHYQSKGDQSNLVRKINYVLRKNRNILAELNPTGKARVSQQALLDRGFNFNYFTNIYITKNKHEYHFCYDQGYIVWEDAYCTLVKRQKYVDK